MKGRNHDHAVSSEMPRNLLDHEQAGDKISFLDRASNIIGIHLVGSFANFGNIILTTLMWRGRDVPKAWNDNQK